jgi:hypothetical protein
LIKIEATKMTRDCTAFLTHPPRGVTAVSRLRTRTESTMYSHRHSPQDRSSVVTAATKSVRSVALLSPGLPAEPSGFPGTLGASCMPVRHSPKYRQRQQERRDLKAGIEPAKAPERASACSLAGICRVNFKRRRK